MQSQDSFSALAHLPTPAKSPHHPADEPAFLIPDDVFQLALYERFIPFEAILAIRQTKSCLRPVRREKILQEGDAQAPHISHLCHNSSLDFMINTYIFYILLLRDTQYREE